MIETARNESEKEIDQKYMEMDKAKSKNSLQFDIVLLRFGFEKSIKKVMELAFLLNDVKTILFT